MSKDAKEKPQTTKTPISKRQCAKRGLIIGLGVIVLLLAGPLFVVLNTRNYSQSERDVGLLPEREVALVFGAGVQPNRTPTLFLLARLEAAAGLYKQGKVKKVLLSGDNRRVDYNEPYVMRQAIIELGVKEEDAIADYGGINTYDSCYRAKNIFEVKSAYLVTQGYHGPRAVQTCRVLGIDAVSVGTSRYWDRYAGAVFPNYMVREVFSINKALFELYISRPKAAVLGEPKPILGE